MVITPCPPYNLWLRDYGIGVAGGHPSIIDVIVVGGGRRSPFIYPIIPDYMIGRGRCVSATLRRII
jgi:hypothetical protein